MADSNRQGQGRKQCWTFYHLNAYVLTFFGYACFHATRKTFSNVKDTMQQEWTSTPLTNATIPKTNPYYTWNERHVFKDTDSAEYFQGLLDSLFMVSYAVGLYISGVIGDRFDMRKVLSFGMCSSAICVFLFGTLTAWLHVYNKAVYIIFWILNGLLQSTGWPAMVAVMANWFGKSSRGFVLGLWSACASVGNIIGSLMVSSVLHFGYEYAFLVTSALLFAMGIIIFFGLVVDPREVGLPSPNEDTVNITVQHGDNEPLLSEENPAEEDSSGIMPTVEAKKPPAIGFFKALLLPGVIPYALSYAALKLVNYSFFFWLPYYLTKSHNWAEEYALAFMFLKVVMTSMQTWLPLYLIKVDNTDQSDADRYSIFYDCGHIVAGTIGGLISDLMGVRSPVCVVMLVISCPVLYGYSVSPDSKTINAVLLAVVGFFIGGPANLISSAISADLGRQDAFTADHAALATVTGIIDGTGSVGAAAGQLLVPLIQEHLNWHWVFYLFMVMTVLTIICILPVFIREIKSMACVQRCRGTASTEPNEQWDIIDDSVVSEPPSDLVNVD